MILESKTAYFLRGVLINGVHLEFLPEERFVGRRYQGVPDYTQIHGALVQWPYLFKNDTEGELHSMMAEAIHVYAEYVGPFANSISLMLDGWHWTMTPRLPDHSSPVWLVASMRTIGLMIYGDKFDTSKYKCMPNTSTEACLELVEEVKLTSRFFDQLMPSLRKLLPKAYEEASLAMALDRDSQIHHYGLVISNKLVAKPDIQRKIASLIELIYAPAKRMIVASPLLRDQLEDRARRHTVMRDHAARQLMEEEDERGDKAESYASIVQSVTKTKKSSKKQQSKLSRTVVPEPTPDISIAPITEEVPRGWNSMMAMVKEMELEEQRRLSPTLDLTVNDMEPRWLPWADSPLVAECRICFDHSNCLTTTACACACRVCDTCRRCLMSDTNLGYCTVCHSHVII